MMAVNAVPQVAAPSSTPTSAADVLDSAGTPGKIPPAAESKTTAPAPEAPQKVSENLRVLIERENAAVKRERAAKEREAAAEAKEAANAEREARMAEFESIKTKNPRKALELLGLNYNQLTEAELNDGLYTPDLKVAKLEEKVQEFIDSQEADKLRTKETAQKQQEQALIKATEQFQTEITDYVKKNSARYELIAFEENESLVYDVIDEHYQRTLDAARKKAEELGEDATAVRGEVLTIAAAADKVESHLEKKYEKAKSLAKVQALLARRQEKLPAPKPTLPQGIQQRQPVPSLSNNLSATPSPTRKYPATDEERKARAIAYAKSLRPDL